MGRCGWGSRAFPSLEKSLDWPAQRKNFFFWAQPPSKARRSRPAAGSKGRQEADIRRSPQHKMTCVDSDSMPDKPSPPPTLGQAKATRRAFCSILRPPGWAEPLESRQKAQQTAENSHFQAFSRHSGASGRAKPPQIPRKQGKNRHFQAFCKAKRGFQQKATRVG